MFGFLNRFLRNWFGRAQDDADRVTKTCGDSDVGRSIVIEVPDARTLAAKLLVELSLLELDFLGRLVRKTTVRQQGTSNGNRGGKTQDELHGDIQSTKLEEGQIKTE